MATFVCHDCGKEKPVQTNGGTGYGTIDGAKVCYECCAIRDRADMIRAGKATLYLQHAAWRITNWPGTLSFPARNVRRFNHPFSVQAYLGEFQGPDGKLWRFKNIGDNDIAHCRRAGGQ